MIKTMAFLLTHIETENTAGTTTVTTDTPGEGVSQRIEGSQIINETSTRTPAQGVRAAVKTSNTDGLRVQKSHHAMQVHLEIPVHNRQPVARP